MAILKKSTAVVMAAVLMAGLVLPGAALGISVGKEKELADEFMKVVERKYDLIQDPFMVSYINDIGQKIVALLPPQPFKYRFYIIRENVYNAFAGPGGHVFVNSGLLEAMETEDELAGILVHEISHVMCRHISERIERSTKIGMASLAGMVAGIFLGGGGNLGQAVTIGSMAAGQSAQLKYSREDEMEADQLGLKYLSQLGYSAQGLLNILKKIRAKQWFGSDLVPSYLTTHPAAEDRIAYIDGWIATHPSDSGSTGGNDSRRFQRVRTRIQALYNDAELSLKRFAALARENPDQVMIHYGYGLALARNNKAAEAASEFRLAVSLDPSADFILADLGRVYYVMGAYQEAVSVLGQAVRKDSEDADAWFYLGRTWLVTGAYDQAVDSLERVMARSPQIPPGRILSRRSLRQDGKTRPGPFLSGALFQATTQSAYRRLSPQTRPGAPHRSGQGGESQGTAQGTGAQGPRGRQGARAQGQRLPCCSGEVEVFCLPGPPLVMVDALVNSFFRPPMAIHPKRSRGFAVNRPAIIAAGSHSYKKIESVPVSGQPSAVERPRPGNRPRRRSWLRKEAGPWKNAERRTRAGRRAGGKIR